ncbi:MAG: Flagellar motor switch protein FliM [Glaciihabitans sp.]|nr:Flagellar motor switch protein FliM [Glaciihabitans sp.]
MGVVTILADEKLPATGAPAAPELYDFRRPTTLAREHSRALELAFETFARQWGTQLTANIRSRSLVTFHQVVMSSYNEYASSLPASTSMVLCNFGDAEAKAVFQFPSIAALSWFSHMLGGDGTHDEAERRLTQLEQILLRKLIDDALDDLRYSFGPILTAPLSIDTIHHNSQLAQAAAPGELMIVATFTVQAGAQSATATFAIPADQVLRRLVDNEPVVTAAEAQELVQAQLVRVPVDVSLQLPPVKTTPAEVLGLSVGDVIPLHYANHKPLDLAVNGRTLARAAVGVHGTRMACVVTDIEENRP